MKRNKNKNKSQRKKNQRIALEKTKKTLPLLEESKIIPLEELDFKGQFANHFPNEEKVAVIHTPKNIAQMSEVFKEYIEPYLHFAGGDLEKVKQLMSFAMLAWNATFLPEKEQKEFFLDIKKKFPNLVIREFFEIFLSLVLRKVEHFSEYDRIIIDYELIGNPTGFRLNVLSSLPKNYLEE